MPFDTFVIADGLHMNDWGYACFAQLLGDDIIRSVGQIKLGVNVPSNARPTGRCEAVAVSSLRKRAYAAAALSEDGDRRFS